MHIEASDLNSHLDLIDIFICSSGFEERSMTVGCSLDANKVNNSIIFHIDDTYQISWEHLVKIQENLPSIEIIPYQKNNPLNTFDIVYKTFDNILKRLNALPKLKVVLDVTTFTREMLLILIKTISLKQFITKFEVLLVYTPAESYSSKADNFWLAKGIREIRSVVGFSGMQSPSKKLMLIILAGFEEERTNEIIQAFEPNALMIGRPSRKSSVNEKLNEISLDKYYTIVEKHNSTVVSEFEFSCNDILDTKEILDEIIKKNQEGYNIVIAPLNNKISTLGVALCGLNNEYIQICYASANQYNIDSYSEKSNYYLIFNFNQLLNNIDIIT